MSKSVTRFPSVFTLGHELLSCSVSFLKKIIGMHVFMYFVYNLLVCYNLP